MRPVVIVPSCIPNDEVRRLFKNFWASLKETAPGIDVFLVDNGSLSNVSGTTRHFFFEKPLGYGKAVNVGIKMATDYDTYIIANNDLTLPHGWLSILEKHKGGMTCATDKKGEDTDRSIWGAFWVTDKKTIEMVGLLDEELNYRFIDQDFAIRCAKAGFPVLRVGDTVCGHDRDSKTVMSLGQDKFFAAEEQKTKEKHGFAHYSEWKRNTHS